MICTYKCVMCGALCSKIKKAKMLVMTFERQLERRYAAFQPSATMPNETYTWTASPTTSYCSMSRMRWLIGVVSSIIHPPLLLINTSESGKCPNSHDLTYIDFHSCCGLANAKP